MPFIAEIFNNLKGTISSKANNKVKNDPSFNDKVTEARSKGVNDSLVLMDQAALIVSAKNATVITAMNRTEAKNQLFTNIDGTIVLN